MHVENYIATKARFPTCWITWSRWTWDELSQLFIFWAIWITITTVQKAFHAHDSSCNSGSFTVSALIHSTSLGRVCCGTKLGPIHSTSRQQQFTACWGTQTVQYSCNGGKCHLYIQKAGIEFAVTDNSHHCKGRCCLNITVFNISKASSALSYSAKRWRSKAVKLPGAVLQTGRIWGAKRLRYNSSQRKATRSKASAPDKWNPSVVGSLAPFGMIAGTTCALIPWLQQWPKHSASIEL